MKKFILTAVLAASIAVGSYTTSNAARVEINCEVPRTFVESVNDSVTGIIVDKSTSDAKKTQLLSELLNDYINIDWIGRFVLGRNWRSLDETQQTEYLKAYKEYILHTYVPIFKQYRGEYAEFISAKPLKRPEEFLVATKIVSPNDPDVAVTYRIQKTGACFKVYDIIAEGVSLINTQRQDFSSIFQRKGFDELLSILRSKSAK